MEESKNSVADIVPIVSKITEHKLNGSNYIEWSKTIKIYLRSVAKDDHLTEEPPNDHTRKLWMQDDARLFLQMKNSINSDIVGLLSHCEFVKELMDYLDFLYSGKGNVSRMYDVWNAFHCPEKGAKSLTAYFMDFKKVYEELNALMPFSPDVRVHRLNGNRWLKFSVEFYELRMSHLLSTPMFLLQKEKMQKMPRRVTNRGGNRAFENRGNDSSTIVCFYCYEAGHTKKNCRKLQNRNRRIQTANVATSDTATFSDSLNKIVTMTAEEFSKYSQYQDALKASTPVSALAESGKTCLVSSSNKWIIDSGATDHMTGNHKTFSTFITHSAPPVTVADGSTYEIKGSYDETDICSLSLGHPSLPVLKKLCPQFDTLPSLDFSTACFLINRMPTVVLKGDIPYKAIHPQKSLFPLAPRIFGCTCYVRDTRPFVTKLDPKALQCAFLGYSRLQKGYRCFSPDLNKYLVSTDVVFSEDTSFFSSPTSSASEEDEEWLVYQVVNSRPTVGQSSVVDFDASLAHSGPVVNIPPAPAKPPIVQVYSRRPVTTDTCPAPAPSSSDPSSDLDLPISLRKASIDSISVPKTVTEALNHPGWKNAMLEEICALEDNHTWQLVDLPQERKLLAASGSLRCQTQFSSTIYFYCCFQQWMIHQLDIKNTFLHGDLEEEVYLEQPPGKEIQAFGMNKSEKDHSVFYKKSAAGIILLVVYVDDIVITRNDHAGISDLKTFMHSKFHTKDLGELKYFLGNRSIKEQERDVLITKEVYDGDPFYNPERYRRVVGKLNYLTVTRPDIAYAVSVVSQFTSAPTIKHWAALEQILCYLKKAPGLGILYSSQGHTRIECFSDADWAGSKFDRRSTTGYCVFFGGNLVAWKSKKQSVVSRSSAESEYRAMAQATCEIIWIHQLLCEVGMKCTMPAKLWCDNQAALHIAANPVYHERTKHIEVDCHFIREKIEENLVSTSYVKTGEQLGDIFTKALNGTRVEYFCNKLGMINIYAPA
ncbi:Retrovirus-related Pol polyprotein from transposon RE1 [Vitis vinifera]|uniref:Retrovirus-related Pol polyprotein from transposon RE1 n=1 Tax=Vitis vinifera TaxID=29760 RepID=A0A438CUS5_VITVI|nr:Retrovirus-related Pol polyprotein from transposon RE1 [Vitis vinifera]